MESKILSKLTDEKLFPVLFICVFLILASTYFIIKDTKQCVANPFSYGIEKIEPEDSSLSCSCFFSNPGYAPFYFNKENINVGSSNG